MISDRYPNKEKRDVLGGLIITRIEVTTVNRRERLYIFTIHEEFGNHELHFIKRWVIFIREVSETHVLEDSEDKEEMG